MKLNRKLFLVVALVLSLAMATTGTLAYLTDTAEDKNTMTLGSVKIEQHEYERVVDDNGNYVTTTVTKVDGSTQESYELREFTQDKPLFPVVGNPNAGYTATYARFEQLGDPRKVQGGQAFLAGIKNGQDKIVLVENTGKSDAYVRTIFAFEMGTLEQENWEELVNCGIITSATPEPWHWTGKGAATINGTRYYIYEAVYNGYSNGNMRHNGGILPSGEWTYNSLAEIYLASKATNEDLEALDGNANGKFDILVLSQAIQVDGFEDDGAEYALNEGFGEVTATNVAEWFKGIAADEGGEDNNPPEDEPTIPTESWLAEGNYDISWYDPTKDSYEISTPEQLAGLAYLVNNHTKNGTYDFPFNEKTIVLAQDIDLGGKIWTPIGTIDTNVHQFWGIFDGNGKTISNLYATGDIGVGLFGVIFHGGDFGQEQVTTVKNVTVDNATIIAKEAAGVIVGHSYGNIIGCTAKNATITANEEAGSIVGYTPIEPSVRINVSNNTAANVSITATRRAGAILGRASDSGCTHENNTWENVTVNGENANEIGN